MSSNSSSLSEDEDTKPLSPTKSKNAKYDQKKKKKKREKAKWSAAEDADLLKGDYAMVKKLCGLSGFGWDDAKMVVTASPEVWDKYLEKHTKWWNKSFPLYDAMAELVDKVLATGSQVFQTQSIQCSSDGPDEAMTVNELDSEVEEIKEIKKGREEQFTGPDAINALAGSVASLAEAIVDSDKALGVSPSLDPSPVRRTKAYQCAEDEEGLSDTDLVDEAKIFGDTKIADTYLAFKKKTVRAHWLRHKLNALNASS
ncbi:hypothetical protein M422DRAFT_257297 [Sphaerobolus stellatus SS14]|uniref:Unplaced genomic scaffold SPHSTscaffold_73, whole genome shotgun sequence n=1 Tax=Sphaerobolus stellatus (strain SS14) TaxID=990650 RepID=A0A0C9VPC5_SPHS4|nr:hypothetical protein M422DRAFT_257297 [Sphaerobolus stellatus SS14]